MPRGEAGLEEACIRGPANRCSEAAEPIRVVSEVRYGDRVGVFAAGERGGGSLWADVGVSCNGGWEAVEGGGEDESFCDGVAGVEDGGRGGPAEDLAFQSEVERGLEWEAGD